MILPASHRKHPTHAIASVHENHGSKDLANADLIAASPELLEALKRILLCLDSTKGRIPVDPRHPEFIEYIEDCIKPIIAKAEGGEA